MKHIFKENILAKVVERGNLTDRARKTLKENLELLGI